MLFVVVIMFAISWLPLQTFSMIMFLHPNIRDGYVYQSSGYNIFIGTYFACHWLSMAHSCLNPLIYCFMNDKFRSDLKALVCRKARNGATYNSTLHLVCQHHLHQLHSNADQVKLEPNAEHRPAIVSKSPSNDQQQQ